MILQAFGGVLAIVIAGAAVWLLGPRNGEPHPVVMKPILETAIPLAIMSLFTLGAAVILGTVGVVFLGAD